jgi:hypothetical protein
MPEAEARYNVAGLAQFNGHEDEAKKQLALALKANPNFEPSKKALASYMNPTEQPIQPVGYSDAPPTSTETPASMPANIRHMTPTSSSQPTGPTTSIESPAPPSTTANAPGAKTPSTSPANGWVR